MLLCYSHVYYTLTLLHGKNYDFVTVFSHHLMILVQNFKSELHVHQRYVQSNLVNTNSTGPSKKVHIKRNFTLTVARCMGVIIPGDFKVVYIKRYFTLNGFVLMRFHCSH